MTIDFEKDQQDAMKKTGNIQSLADQVERLEGGASEIEDAESRIKLLKKKRDHISGDIIPTMMSEMGLAELKLHDITSKSFYVVSCYHNGSKQRVGV